MSQSNQNWSVIPRTAWLVAALTYVALAAAVVLGPLQFETELMRWHLGLKLLLVLLAPLTVALYVLLVGFIYGDAKRRGMRHVMWAWLALIPYFIGVAAYFITRHPLPQPCPSCKTLLPARYVFCPHCGTGVTPFCSNCGKPVERGWANCAYCGAKLRAPEQKTEAS